MFFTTLYKSSKSNEIEALSYSRWSLDSIKLSFYPVTPFIALVCNKDLAVGKLKSKYTVPLSQAYMLLPKTC